MITVHHLNNSRSQRIIWLAEELGLDYALERYERAPVLAPPQLRAVHPLGKSPVITDGETTVAETGAIVEYLVERYGAGRLIPSAGTPQRLAYRYWLHYAEGSAMPPLLVGLFLGRVGDAAAPMRAMLDMQINLHFDFIEAELAKSAWFAGPDFTAADIMMSFPLEMLEARDLLAARPNSREFLKRIHSREAYQRALARGGHFDVRF